MTYRFVQAHDDYGPRNAPTLALVIHMAEGGSTVSYLSHATPRGVSVHYVVELDGEIVQMLLESHTSGSLNPRDIRTTNGPEPFGIKAARACLGQWISDPNRAVLSVEVEGFAKDGPNPRQVDGLQTLVGDLRTRYQAIGLLGHRDFQDYKACPGARIPWALLGGHGPSGGIMGLQLEFTDDDRRGVLRFERETPVRVVATGARDTLPAGAVRRARAWVRAPELGGSGWLIGNAGEPELFVGATSAPELGPWPGGSTIPALDCSDAVAADRLRARITYD